MLDHEQVEGLGWRVVHRGEGGGRDDAQPLLRDDGFVDRQTRHHVRRVRDRVHVREQCHILRRDEDVRKGEAREARMLLVTVLCERLRELHRHCDERVVLGRRQPLALGLVSGGLIVHKRAKS